MGAEKTLNQVLIEELTKLKEKREALRLQGLPIIKNQSVMIPIPNKLVQEKNPEVCKFIETLGLIKRNKALGVPASIQAGEEVVLQDGSKTTIVELVFYYTDETDIEAVSAFINENA